MTRNGKTMAFETATGLSSEAVTEISDDQRASSLILASRTAIDTPAS